MNGIEKHRMAPGWALRLCVAILATASLAGVSLAGDDAVTLHVNDAVVRPGGTLGIVLRTYEPRAVGQGQVCLRLLGAPGIGPLLALDAALVFSVNELPVVSSSFDILNQSSFLWFHSSSAGVNTTDGPMIALLVEVRSDVVPGTVYPLELESADTSLFDENGNPLILDLRAGEVTILDPAAPFSLSADGEEGAQGGLMVVGVETAESMALESGQVTLLYDPVLVDGTPVVHMDPRHGGAVFTTDTATPGQVRVSFSSLVGSLNQVPGQFISVTLPIATNAPLGVSPLRLDPATTFLFDANGEALSLALQDDEVGILPGDVVFADGFETGDLSRWSNVVP